MIATFKHVWTARKRVRRRSRRASRGAVQGAELPERGAIQGCSGQARPERARRIRQAARKRTGQQTAHRAAAAIHRQDCSARRRRTMGERRHRLSKQDQKEGSAIIHSARARYFQPIPVCRSSCQQGRRGVGFCTSDARHQSQARRTQHRLGIGVHQSILSGHARTRRHRAQDQGRPAGSGDAGQSHRRAAPGPFAARDRRRPMVRRAERRNQEHERDGSLGAIQSRSR